jgi:hypothetical protein
MRHSAASLQWSRIRLPPLPPPPPPPLLAILTLLLVCTVPSFGAEGRSSASLERPLLPLPSEPGAVGHAWMFGARAGGSAGAEAARWSSGGVSSGGGGGGGGAGIGIARIAFVCSEFSGLVPNGGIGTFYSALAESLAEVGQYSTHRVWDATVSFDVTQESMTH